MIPPWVLFFVVVVGIPVIAGVLGDAWKRHLRFKEKQLEAMSHETAEKAARYAAQTERLEQRVRVLERILTDKGMNLAAEIEDLRDAPPAPAPAIAMPEKAATAKEKEEAK